jgi:pyruvate formate lyase activating enzyme
VTEPQTPALHLETPGHPETPAVRVALGRAPASDEPVELGPEWSIVPTTWWHELADGRIQCDVCPRACKLREGQRGVCFVRARRNDQVVLATWGRSSGFCVDPIEKKPLNHFLPGTSVLSFGTAGCNLACRFCQNWDISKSKQVDTLADQADPVTIARAARELGCASVAFTYNDPTIFLEYAIDVADACHDEGIRAVAVTAGYIEPGPRAELYAHIDAANVDLKGFTERFYRHVAMGALAPVLDTLRYLVHETDVWTEITTLLIPGENDSDEELHAECEWIATELGVEVPLHFSAFHPDYKMLDVPHTPPATLTRARRIALEHGLVHVYTGNVHDEVGGTTTCTGCGAPVVVRDWYELRAYRLNGDGRCQACATPLAGVFDGPPGEWGRQRLPVRLADHATTGIVTGGSARRRARATVAPRSSAQRSTTERSTRGMTP